jgi:Tfp pilus assembly protein PilN
LWGTVEEEGCLKQEASLSVTRFSSGTLKMKFPSGLGENLPWAAVGGAMALLNSEARSCDLLSRGTPTRKNRSLPGAGVLVLAIVAVLVFYLVMPLYLEGKKLRETDRQVAVRKEAVRKAELLKRENEAIRSEINTILDFKENTAPRAKLVKGLTSLLPKSVWLTRLRITDKAIEMEGYAKSPAEVLSRVLQSGVFINAQLLNAPARDPRIAGDAFSLKADIAGYHADAERTVQNGPKQP